MARSLVIQVCESLPEHTHERIGKLCAPVDSSALARRKSHIAGSLAAVPGDASSARRACSSARVRARQIESGHELQPKKGVQISGWSCPDKHDLHESPIWASLWQGRRESPCGCGGSMSLRPPELPAGKQHEPNRFGHEALSSVMTPSASTTGGSSRSGPSIVRFFSFERDQTDTVRRAPLHWQQQHKIISDSSRYHGPPGETRLILRGIIRHHESLSGVLRSRNGLGLLEIRERAGQRSHGSDADEDFTTRGSRPLPKYDDVDGRIAESGPGKRTILKSSAPRAARLRASEDSRPAPRRTKSLRVSKTLLDRTGCNCNPAAALARSSICRTPKSASGQREGNEAISCNSTRAAPANCCPRGPLVQLAQERSPM